MTRRMASHFPTLIALVALGALASGACTPVPPEKRGYLAHPTMVADDMSNAMHGHVRDVSEGAAGGIAGGAGGGCGCN